MRNRRSLAALLALAVYSNGGYAGGPPAELIFTTEQRTFSFDLPPGTNEKMLIHNSRSDHPYPSPDQIPTAATALPRFHFGGKVTARSGSAESDVWLRVVDPEGPAPYLPAGLSFRDDNRDPLPKGTLMTSGCAAPSCRVSGRSTPGRAAGTATLSAGIQTGRRCTARCMAAMVGCHVAVHALSFTMA